jgi:RNA polymerase sigma-70 factor (ECF subfamily)
MGSKAADADYFLADQPKYEDLRYANIPEAVFAGELQQKIEESVASLPEKQRTAMFLLLKEDLSYDEAAIVLGTSVLATRGLIHRARQKLKRQLHPYLRTGVWAAKPQSHGKVPQFS